MNKPVLMKYNIEFYKSVGGIRFLNSETNWLSTYLYIYRDVDTLVDFINDLDLAINDNFNQIIDPDWGLRMGEYWNAHVTPSGFEIWQNGTEKTIIPLTDMREILTSWKEFLEPG